MQKNQQIRAYFRMGLYSIAVTVPTLVTMQKIYPTANFPPTPKLPQLMAKRQRLCVQNDYVLGDEQFLFGMYDPTTSEEVTRIHPISKSEQLYPYWAGQFHILRKCVGMKVQLQLSHLTKNRKHTLHECWIILISKIYIL